MSPSSVSIDSPERWGWVGGPQNSSNLGCGTAPGIRMKKVEIKYKKPTPHCGSHAPKMIHRDSFDKSFRSARRSRRRNDGDIATKLNQFGSPEPLLARSRARVVPQQGRLAGGQYEGGRGVSNLYDRWGSLPHGSHPQIFRGYFAGKFSDPGGAVESLRPQGLVTAGGRTHRFFSPALDFNTASGTRSTSGKQLQRLARGPHARSRPKRVFVFCRPHPSPASKKLPRN